MNGLKSTLLALISGALFALSLPPYNHEWLGWFALAPFIIAVQRRSALEAMGLGMLVGVAGGVIHARWNADTSRLLFGYLPFLWLSFLFGGVAIVAQGMRDEKRGPLFGVFIVACMGVTGEWLTTWLPMPVNIALSQYQHPMVIQIAAITGMWGVSFLLWWINAAIADAVMAKRLWSHPMGVAVILVAITLGYGCWELRPHVSDNAKTLRVAAIQDYTGRETADLAPPPSLYVDAKYRETMTREVVERGAQLVVWSEEFLGPTFLPQTGRDPTIRLVRELKTHLIVGYSDGSEPKPFNCAAIVGPDGSVLGVHHKVHLFIGESANLQAGSSAIAFPTDIGKIGMEVCFDSIYTDVTRHLAQFGAQIVAMPNFDPPTPHGVLHYLHDAMLPFRAVENHVPFVRSDSNGLSQIVDLHGRVLGQSPLYQVDELMGTVTLGDGKGTFFTRTGDWVAYLCLLMMAGMGIAAVRDRKKTRNGSEAPLL